MKKSSILAAAAALCSIGLLVQGCLGASDDCKLFDDCSAAVASCTDGKQNHGESAIDCGGPVCRPCALGQTCLDADGRASGGNCESGHCADGVCCDGSCAGECESCDGRATGAAMGACAPMTAGTDPDGECEPEEPGTCGNSDGTCSGAARCNKQGPDTVCGDPPSCVGADRSNPDHCDGEGACADGGKTGCNGYACFDSECKQSCSEQSHCDGDHFCAAAECVRKKPAGQICNAEWQCLSGFCVDGVCCAGACDGTCERCDLWGARGECTAIAEWQDPHDECPGSGSCDGLGSCMKLPNGAPCSAGSQCANLACVDGVCCNTLCTAGCFACSASKKGYGQNGVCNTIDVNRDPDDECPGSACDGNGHCQ
jgi:hypothetical protein